MPQAIVNPEELERFAGNLKKFNEQLPTTMTSNLNGQLGLVLDSAMS